MRIADLSDAVAEKMLADRRRSDLAAEKVASRIVADVRKRGDQALFAWTHQLDHVRLTPKSLWVRSGIDKDARQRRSLAANSAAQVTPGLRAALEHAARNIRRVAERQLPRSWSIAVEPGVRVGQRVTPLDTIGCYVPGGRHSLVSTLLMTAVPAQVAGVKRIVVACPKANPALFAVA